MDGRRQAPDEIAFAIWRKGEPMHWQQATTWEIWLNYNSSGCLVTYDVSLHLRNDLSYRRTPHFVHKAIRTPWILIRFTIYRLVITRTICPLITYNVSSHIQWITWILYGMLSREILQQNLVNICLKIKVEKFQISCEFVSHSPVKVNKIE